MEFAVNRSTLQADDSTRHPWGEFYPGKDDRCTKSGMARGWGSPWSTFLTCLCHGLTFGSISPLRADPWHHRPGQYCCCSPSSQRGGPIIATPVSYRNTCSQPVPSGRRRPGRGWRQGEGRGRSGHPTEGVSPCCSRILVAFDGSEDHGRLRFALELSALCKKTGIGVRPLVVRPPEPIEIVEMRRSSMPPRRSTRSSSARSRRR
jgi:hypothetical protein